MTEKLNIVPLRDLNLMDRFLFDEVMENLEAHQEILSIILEQEVSLMEKPETEKEFRISPQLRSIRLDVFSIDDEKNVFNTEMQKQRRNDLKKRSRFYQGLMDAGLLEVGVLNYNLLNDSYIVIITPYDLFGHGRYKYTFRAYCEEVPELKLEDGATRIFLNTRGKSEDGVSKELIEFLHYVEHTTDKNAESTESIRIQRIHEQVRKVKLSEEAGVKYMQAWEEKWIEREEAMAEGRAKGRVEGRAEGRTEGKVEGELLKVILLVQKKFYKGLTTSEIADILEEPEQVIESIVQKIKQNPDSTNEQILEMLKE